MATSLRLVGYARVSTNGQALKAASVPEQISDMREWCETHGHQLVAVCAEENGVSGTEGLDGRFAFVEALDVIRRGDADGLLVRELDRLARDVLIQEQFVREIWDGGGEILSTHPSESNLRDDPEDPTRKLIRRLIGCVHEWEREMIRLRLRRGRAHKARQGHYVGGFGRKYGFALIASDGKHDWQPVEDEQEVIARIVAGRSDGLTFQGVADELNRDGVAAPSGQSWYAMTVKRIAEREAVAA